MKAIIIGKVFTVTGQTFDKATVLVDNGKIKAVGPDIELPEGTEVIDASGCWVTPGLIDCHTHISTVNEPGTLTGSDGTTSRIERANSGLSSKGRATRLGT